MEKIFKFILVVLLCIVLIPIGYMIGKMLFFFFTDVIPFAFTALIDFWKSILSIN